MKDKKKDNPYGKKCPKCGNDWKITVFNVKIWYDCEKCGDTAENLVKKHKKSPKSTKIFPESNESWDLLVDNGFESMGIDDDDDWF